jgi:hypothetical protein
MAQSLPLENEIAGVFAKFPQLPDVLTAKYWTQGFPYFRE